MDGGLGNTREEEGGGRRDRGQRRKEGMEDEGGEMMALGYGKMKVVEGEMTTTTTTITTTTTSHWHTTTHYATYL